MVSAAQAHPWKLVGPWYRWERAALPSSGRQSAPALQKFAGGEFIADFLAQPQRSLKFDPQVDVVSHIGLLPAGVGAGQLKDKLSALFLSQLKTENGKTREVPIKPTDVTAAILKNIYRSRLVPSTLRKLYLPLHDRHYLVVCELHCDVPGFPSVARNEVCQAGFVVRRRQRVVPAEKANQAAALAQAVRVIEAELAELQELAPLRDDLAMKRKAAIAALKQLGQFEAVLAKLEQQRAEAEATMQAFFQQAGIGVRIEGWYPRCQDGKPSKTLGRWQLAEEAAAEGALAGDEHVFPLFPLVPDPREAGHDAAGRTIYYGVVPADALQYEPDGRKRFDDVATYQIQCFVRRHKPGLAKHVGEAKYCCCERVWSAPTEPYRLAASFDSLGCANRPITIKMPDLRELAAQVAARPRGKLSPVRIIQPQQLKPKVSDTSVSGGSLEGAAICFFSIPLITIVALFVLHIFLPIVVLIFQLWFLLLLRFCIPPRIQFGGALDAKLAAQPPSMDFDADFSVAMSNLPAGDVDFDLNGQVLDAAALNARLKTHLIKRMAEDGQLPEAKIALDAFSNNALVPLNQSYEDAKNQPQDPEQAPAGSDFAAGLEYEPRREPEWVLQGGRG